MTATDLPTLADAYGMPRVMETPGGARDFMAQVVAYEQRTERHPDRNHWGPTDQNDPGDDGPKRVLDGDGALWKRLSRGPNAGKWRMRSFNPDQHEARAGQALPWQQLAYHYGPLTEAAEGDR